MFFHVMEISVFFEKHDNILSFDQNKKRYIHVHDMPLVIRNSFRNIIA